MPAAAHTPADEAAAIATLEHAFRNVDDRALRDVRVADIAQAFADYRAKLCPAGDRSQALEVDIEDGRLVISIGVDTLLVAARGGDTWPDDEEFAVTNVDGFADDIRHELVGEEEDGTTLVHIAIDTAVERALDAGSLNVTYGDD